MEQKTTNKFADILQQEDVVLVDFSAEWCGPCKMMKPILEEVKSKVGDKARILKVDVDKNPALAASYEIQGVPTLMIFKQGKLVWRQSGVMQAPQLVRLLMEQVG
ncbi:MAG: thioredoxin [Bacteroidota bacterium]|jgi:thioredoxin 1